MFRRSPSRSRSSRSQNRSRSRSGTRSPCRSRRESEAPNHRGASIDLPNPESIAALKRKRAKLNRVFDELLKLRKRIRKKVDKMGVKIDRIEDAINEFKRADTLPTAVIHFVHLLEKATLYFEFKTSATRKLNFEHSHSPAHIYSILIHDQKLMSDLKNIEVSDIHMAANAIYRESICKLTQLEDDWIYMIVSLAHQGDYAMDQDPEVELKKMMKSVPDFYDSYFGLKRLPAKCKKISKQEAYEKYSELVSIVNSRAKGAKGALKEKHNSQKRKRVRDRCHLEDCFDME